MTVSQLEKSGVLNLSNRQYKEFQELVPWKIGTRLPDGRMLGHDLSNRMTADGVEDDPVIKELFNRMDTADKRVLELGCFEAHQTVFIAPRCKEVVAVEVRPRNVINALVRLFIYGVKNVQLLLLDVRDIDASFGEFDILFHAGVLYHLENPVEHLYKIASIAPVLVLDTHFCEDDETRERSDIAFKGKTYRAHLFKEGGWEEPLSGVEPYSRWLHRDSLFQLLADVGYENVKENRVIKMEVGSRITLIATRSGGDNPL